jgi:hypothetical protein
LISGEADGEDDVDDEEPNSKPSAAKSNKLSSTGKLKFGQSASNPEKSKEDSKTAGSWKQGPWAFLKDIKDVREYNRDFTASELANPILPH